MDRPSSAEEPMRWVIAAGLLVSVGSWSADVFAYRPFDSTDADVARVREVELELGPVQYFHDDKDHVLVVPALIANLGFVERWELVLEGRNWVRLDRAPGQSRLTIVDVALSAKGILRAGCLQGGTGLSVATELGALIPTNEEEPGPGASATLFLSQRYEFGTAHFNAGLALTRRHDAAAFGGAIVEGPIAWPVRPVAEGLLERDFGVMTLYSGLVGAIWRARDNLSFDAAVRLGRSDNGVLTEVRGGLTWAFDL
jgi:hypothetical protein